MSLVKWWLTQQAFPRSAILTLIISYACISSALRFSPVVNGGVADLSSEMPETSFVSISAVFSRCFWLSSPLSLSDLGDGSLDLEPARITVSDSDNATLGTHFAALTFMEDLTKAMGTGRWE